MMQIHSQRPRYWLDANQSNPEMAASDAAAIAVFKRAGLCEHDDYMTYEEAARVVRLPQFGYTGKGADVVNWDWSALSNLRNTNGWLLFFNCRLLDFDYLPREIDDGRVTNWYTGFYGCTNLALTSLPEGFGSVAKDMSQLFKQCTNLALTSLPEGFGSVAKDMSYCFGSCTNLALTSLPEGFGSVATNMTQLFTQCTNLALTSLPEGFGSVATYMASCFGGCTNLKLTSLPEGFGSVATNMSYCFSSCRSFKLTSLPEGFGSVAKDISRCFENSTVLSDMSEFPVGMFANCTHMGLAFWNATLPKKIKLNNNNFGKYNGGTDSWQWYWMFRGTAVEEFTDGAFDFSSVVSDVKGVNQGLNGTFNNIVRVIRFVPNTLKYSSTTLNTGLISMDTDSLKSFAECLFNFYDEELGEFVGNEGKYWQPTTAQKTILENTDYEEGYTYAEYVTDKGWELR